MNESLVLNIVQKLVRPVARFCVRNSINLQEVIAALKIELTNAARSDLDERKIKWNVNRVSLISGVHRKDVAKILKQEVSPPARSESITSRVLTVWENDKRFTYANGSPKTLTFGGEEPNFQTIVKAVSIHLNPRTVLLELRRTESVVENQHGIKPSEEMHRLRKDLPKRYDLLAQSIDCLTEGVSENIQNDSELPNVHIRTDFDNIVVSELPEIRRWLMDQTKQFHKKVRNYLAAFDVDVYPDAAKNQTAGAKVVYTSFSLTDTPLTKTEINSDSEKVNKAKSSLGKAKRRARKARRRSD